MLTRYAEAYRFYRYGRTMDFGTELDRLVRPLNDTFDYTGIKTMQRRYTLFFFLREIEKRGRSYWGWTTDEWIDTINARVKARQHAVAIAYLLCSFSDLHRLRVTMSSIPVWPGKCLGESTQSESRIVFRDCFQNGATVEGVRLHKSCARSLNACCSCARRI
jgi:hypothetical protein